MADPKPRRPFGRSLPGTLASLRKRLANLVPTERWTDLMYGAHDRSFAVAGAMQADLLADLARAVDEAIREGAGIEAFRKKFDAAVLKYGWGYNGARDWRTRVIYRTNVATSYAAGRLQQLRDPDLLRVKPYWMYVHSDAVATPRPLHLSWNGIALPADHEWFKTHFAPNGWGCMCRIVAVSKRDIERLGGRLLETPPDDGSRDVDGRDVPNGIDYGWDYMPGATVGERFTKQAVKNLPEPLAVALTLDLLLAQEAEWTRTRGLAVGGDIEFASLVDATGKVAFRKRGGRRSVSFNNEQAKLMPGGTLLHNHPGSSSLSDADLRATLSMGLREVWAQGHDGTRYIARVLATDAAALATAIKKADRAVRAALNPRIKELGMGSVQRWHSHLVNRLLDRRGLIDYQMVGNAAPAWVDEILKDLP